MNIRKQLIDVLYPMCSDEVKILIDQMRNKPEKFDFLFYEVPYEREDTPWRKVLHNTRAYNSLESSMIRNQITLLQRAWAKRMILEGLLGVPTETTQGSKQLIKRAMKARYDR